MNPSPMGLRWASLRTEPGFSSRTFSEHHYGSRVYGTGSLQTLNDTRPVLNRMNHDGHGLRLEGPPKRCGTQFLGHQRHVEGMGSREHMGQHSEGHGGGGT